MRDHQPSRVHLDSPPATGRPSSPARTRAPPRHPACPGSTNPGQPRIDVHLLTAVNGRTRRDPGRDSVTGSAGSAARAEFGAPTICRWTARPTSLAPANCCRSRRRRRRQPKRRGRPWSGRAVWPSEPTARATAAAVGLCGCCLRSRSRSGARTLDESSSDTSDTEMPQFAQPQPQDVPPLAALHVRHGSNTQPAAKRPTTSSAAASMET